MKKFYVMIFALLPLVAFANPVSLHDTLFELDRAVFDTFNRCSDPDILSKHSEYFAVDVEFYHDNGGVTWDRATMLANTKKYACGNFTRKLIDGSLNVNPIKDFGAITEGVHVFCQTDTQKCEGKAKFVMVWRNKDDKWQITRVLSYGHQSNH